MAFAGQRSAERTASLVTAAGAHLGAVLDPDGERLTLVDDEGRVLTDTQALLALVRLVAEHVDGDTIVVPVTASIHIERMVEGTGVTVRQAKTSYSALMAAADEPGVGFAASTDGGFIVPGFLPAFDAAAALLKLLELLARHDVRLSSVVDDLPRPHIARETVVTPWDQKGMVMRSLVERAEPDRLVLVDGVKVLHDDGWALALPDPAEPLTHIWAEATTDATARSRAQEYGRRLRQLVR
jgi:mannose-1-phosphate guanylyltransferase/phosphomannomutase